MRSLRSVSIFARTEPPSVPASSLRGQVKPPSLCHRPDSPWLRLLSWLLAPGLQNAAPPLNRLPAVRRDFLACLADTRGDDAVRLAQRIDDSRSLRELWHLRTAVYRVVAVSHSQAEAEQRLARLNRHFPTRAVRSGFVPL
jgi:hypothetical protein